MPAPAITTAARRLLRRHRDDVEQAIERRDFVIRGMYRQRDLELGEIAKAAGVTRLRTAWIVRSVKRYPAAGPLPSDSGQSPAP